MSNVNIKTNIKKHLESANSNKADHTIGLHINILDSSLTNHITTESKATDWHHERPINMVANC